MRRLDSVEVEREVAAFEFVEDVGSTSVNRDVDGGLAFACALEEGIGSVVEKKLDDEEAVVAAEGLVEGGESPGSDGVGVGAVLERELDAVFVVPVGFAEQDGVEAGLVERAAGEDDFEDGVVVGFGDVVRGLFVVGVGSVVEEELGEAWVLGDAGGSVDG